MFDSAAYAVRNGDAIAWGRQPVTDLEFVCSFAEAKARLENYRSSDDGPYVDEHGWHFTPSSFRLAALELEALEAIDYTIDRTFPTEGCEFYVTLRRGRQPPADPDQLEAARLDLLRRTFAEVGEQIDLLAGDSTAPAPPVEARLEHELDALREDRDRLLRNYELAMSSKSWRLTAPLRRVGALLRR
jgi:hypothetical protein